MGKLKAFFYSFYKSLTSLSYYNDIVNVNTGFSIKYFLLLTLTASLLISFSTFFTTANDIKKEVFKIFEAGEKIYPDDLVITTKDGLISINQPEPYFIPIPISPENPWPENIGNILVFDSNGTLDDLERYKTLALLNKTNFLVKSENKIEAYPIKDMNLPDGQVTKADFLKLLGKIKPFVSLLPAVIFVFLLLVILFYYVIFRAIYLVLVALILAGAGNIKGLKLNFSKYHQIAVHTFTLPLLIELAASFVNFNIPVPFWFFAINIAFGILAVSKLNKPA